MNALVDAAGTRHPRAAPGARIVSLVPSITELLFDLDLAAAVVGRTTFCVHPREAVAGVPRVGGTKTPDLARIRALGATHVVVNVDENRREHAQALADQGLQVIVTHPQAPRDNLDLYCLLGGIFGRDAQARALCDAFLDASRALERAVSARPRQRVLYLIWRDPWMTVSPSTYISRCLAMAGLDTLAPDDGERYPRVERPAELAGTLDAVLLSSEPFPFKARHEAEIRQACGRPDLTVTGIDAEMTSWYGSRAIAGCRYLAHFAEHLHQRLRQR